VVYISTDGGTGVSPDSAYYLGAAESLVEGRGFKVPVSYPLDNSDFHPLELWPPLYPFLLALPTVLGTSPVQGARVLSLVFFPLLVLVVFITGLYLGRQISPGVDESESRQKSGIRPEKREGGLISDILGTPGLVGWVACAGLVSLAPIIYVCSFAWSELPFIFFSSLSILLFVWLGRKMDQVRSEGAAAPPLWPWLVVALPVSLACLTRYVGLILVPVGIFAVIRVQHSLEETRRFWSGLLVFVFFSVLPISAWFVRNLLLSGYLTGMTRNPPGLFGFMGNLVDLLQTLLVDFFPRPALGMGLLSALRSLIPIALVVLALGFAVFLFMGSGRWKARELLKKFGEEFKSTLHTTRALVFFVLLYSFGLCATRTYFREDIIGTRLASPLYPVLLVIGALFVGRAWSSRNRVLRMALVILVIGFISVHALSLSRLLEKAEDYRQFNSPYWLEDEGVLWASANAPVDLTIFSNHADGLSFLLRRPVHWVPAVSRTEVTGEWMGFAVDLPGPHLVMLYSFNARERNTVSKEDLPELQRIALERDFEIVIKFNTSRVSCLSFQPGEMQVP